MIDSIRGVLARKEKGMAVLALGGIGYALQVPARTLAVLPLGEEAVLYTHLCVREDSLHLYGFATPFERALFRKIMGVTGIGAALAMNLLSELTPEQFLNAVAKENTAILQGVKKVGARTAKRLVLELKGKLDLLGAPSPAGEIEVPLHGAESSNLGQDLFSALMALGYPRNAAKEAAAKALAAHPGEDDLEILLRTALKPA